MSCPVQYLQMADIKTLSEYGVNTPYIWQQIVANKNINEDRRKDFESIFSSATKKIGSKTIQELSDQIPPIFNNVDSRTHYYRSLIQLKAYRVKFNTEIEASR